MTVLVVYAHPEPTSFCSALRDAAVEAIVETGKVAVVSDLYAEGFNPVAGRHDFVAMADKSRLHYQTEQANAARTGNFSEEIAREQARVAAAEAIIVVFPLWWGGPPAILKGWVDRVLAYGFAYEDGLRFESGLFRGKRSLIGVTTGGTEARFAADGVYGEIDKVLLPIQHLTLDYMGLEAEPIFACYGTPRVSAETRAGYLAAWRQSIRTMLAKGPVPTGKPEVTAPTQPAPWTRTV